MYPSNLILLQSPLATTLQVECHPIEDNKNSNFHIKQ
jgi:hypothetical protein